MKVLNIHFFAWIFIDKFCVLLTRVIKSMNKYIFQRQKCLYYNFPFKKLSWNIEIHKRSLGYNWFKPNTVIAFFGLFTTFQTLFDQFCLIKDKFGRFYSCLKWSVACILCQSVIDLYQQCCRSDYIMLMNFNARSVSFLLIILCVITWFYWQNQLYRVVSSANML